MYTILIYAANERVDLYIQYEKQLGIIRKYRFTYFVRPYRYL